MVRPVHHIVGGHHDQRLDFLVTVALCLLVLLMVVGSIDIEPSVMLDGGRVGTELEVQQGVGHAGPQLRGSYDSGLGRIVGIVGIVGLFRLTAFLFDGYLKIRGVATLNDDGRVSGLGRWILVYLDGKRMCPGLLSGGWFDGNPT